MKHIHLLLSLFIVSAANAQITLTSAITPQIGDSFNYVTATNIPYSAGPSGANQTWNFSTSTGTTGTVNYISPSNASASNYFPNATIVASNTDGETYMSYDASGLYLEGHNVPNVIRVTYQNMKRTSNSFPMSYNDTYNSTFSGTSNVLFAGQSYTRTGTTEIVYDGYGTLILPYGTINNVIRTRTATTTTDSYFGIPIGTSYDTVFTWYDNSNKTYLAGHTVIHNAGSVLRQFSFLAQSSFVTSNKDVFSEELALTIFPNPASDAVTIRGAQPGNIFDIYDMSGKLVQTFKIFAFEQKIDISSLDLGIYMLRGISGDAVISEKLIVE